MDFTEQLNALYKKQLDVIIERISSKFNLDVDEIKEAISCETFKKPIMEQDKHGSPLREGVTQDGRPHNCEYKFGARSKDKGKYCYEVKGPGKAKYAVAGKWYCGNITKNETFTGHLKSAHGEYIKNKQRSTPATKKSKSPTLKEIKEKKTVEVAKLVSKKVFIDPSKKVALKPRTGTPYNVYKDLQIAFDKNNIAVGNIDADNVLAPLSKKSIRWLDSHNFQYKSGNVKENMKSNKEIVKTIKKEAKVQLKQDEETTKNKAQLDISEVISESNESSEYEEVEVSEEEIEVSEYEEVEVSDEYEEVEVSEAVEISDEEEVSEISLSEESSL